MRTGISIAVRPADRRRLGSILADRNSPQKHVWRARIVLLTADGDPPAHAIVLSIDEKSQIHALDRTQPGLR